MKMKAANLRSFEDILRQEFNAEFVRKMEQHCVMGYFKYGPLGENAGSRLTDMVENLEKNLKRFKETGNTEYLIDVAVYAMYEFTCPQHANAHYKPTDSCESAGYAGTSYRDIERL